MVITNHRDMAATRVTIFSSLLATANLILTYAFTQTQYVPNITRHFICVALADLIRYIFHVFLGKTGATGE